MCSVCLVGTGIKVLDFFEVDKLTVTSGVDTGGASAAARALGASDSAGEVWLTGG